MQAVARYTNCPIAPRKMRLVADIVRGKEVSKAFDILKFARKEGAVWINKVLQSAVANWGVLAEKDPSVHDLFIKEIRIDGAFQLKRLRPAPHGRGHRIRKRFDHITIIVENRKEISEN